jgi:hypothetical protein
MAAIAFLDSCALFLLRLRELVIRVTGFRKRMGSARQMAEGVNFPLFCASETYQELLED